MDEKLKTKEIGQRIREIRQSKKMTQNDLAFEAHISPSKLSDIELGKSKMWLTTFVRIVEALQVSADVILRPDTPEVNVLYQKEYAELLSDCSPSEIEAIIKIVKQVKTTLHAPKENTDY